MVDLRVSVEARRDFREIKDRGVREFGPERAREHLAGFGRLFRLLRDQPFAGQERPDIEAGVRSLSHRPHRILYEIESDIVVILRIIHQARDVRRAFEGEQ